MRLSALGFVALAVLIACKAGAQTQSGRGTPGSEAKPPMTDESQATPTNLRDCYMRIAMNKVNPDAMYLARQICDQLFKKLDPSSLALYDAKGQKCTEWFFDGDGRYETSELYCAFEPRGESKYVLACEAKDAKSRRFSYAELTKMERRYEKTKTAGFDLGLLFTGMAGCIEHKAQLGLKSD
ncbi:MAG: hypothetical protein ACAI38_12085 [Myxococcota bacterium]